MQSARPLLLAAAAIALAAALVDAAWYRAYLIDDTFISLRYARNWIEGHGLVFNLGERVEGFTNLSFVVLAGWAMRVGIDPISATKAVSALAALATLALVAWIERRTAPPAASPPTIRADGVLPLSVLLLLPLQSFAYWAVASFETMWFTALLTAAVACRIRERERGGHWSALCIVALVLTRPEGILLGIAAYAAFWLVGAGRAATSGRPYKELAFIGAALAALTAWRWSYYGHLLPNTFYAKVTGDSAQLATGLRQLGDWAREYPLPAATLALPLLLLASRGRDAARRAPIAVALYLISAVYTVYVAAIGGDFMPFFRFNLPVLPLQCVLLAVLLRALDRSALVVAAVAVNLLASHTGEQPYRAFVADRTAVVGERVGAYLRQHLGAGELIAVNTAGAVPYVSGLPALDMLGLTDAAIAQRPVYVTSTGWAGHRRGWGAYVVGRRPRVILWYNSAGLREPHYLSDRELADNPYFRFFYAPRRADLPAQEADAVLARFLGAPFGGAADRAVSPDLGMTAEVRRTPVEHTILRDRAIEVVYFERDQRDEPLWALAAERSSDVAGFVDAVAARWATAPPPPTPQPAALAAVESLSEQARAAAQAGDFPQARALLQQAVQRNAEVRSPLVYQYVANVAVLTGDLFTAVAAQKEALRLAPNSSLYRQNLARLLTVPYAEGSQPNR